MKLIHDESIEITPLNRKMKIQYNYELIRDYLHGLLDNKTAKEVSGSIKTDETARSIAEGILRLEKEFSSDDNAIEKYLEDFRQKQIGLTELRNDRMPIIKQRWFRIAASLLILISVGVAIRLTVFTPNLQTVVEQELSVPYPLSNLARGEANGAAKERAFQFYAQRDFPKASVYFEQALAEERENASVTFYGALNYLYQGNFDRAVDLLESDVIRNSRYARQGQWYQALALIRLGNKNKSIQVLDSIVNDKQHFKHEAATGLLKLLE
ncbi:MAG: hypothetical protein K2U26_03785 [Cyclobacteriaceae bacterium]|nr:hypothetical protein [Cyclobacteriaceae bacterium]